MRRAAILGSLIALALGGCAVGKSAGDVVVDYNRAFAKSRDELLLLNILRASAREPLQFSTMGAVTGSVGNDGGIEIPFTNLIAGGANAISPTVRVNGGVNPAVTIVPLSTQEFAEGILRPIAPETIQLFLHNGWDAEFVLPLIVGGVICPDRRLLLNSGEYDRQVPVRSGDGAVQAPVHEAFKLFFRQAAAAFTIGREPLAGAARRSFTLSDREALATLKDGIGENYVVADVEDAGAEKKRIVVQPAAAAVIRGIDPKPLCDRIAAGTASAPLTPEAIASISGVVDIAAAEGGAASGKIIFRSVGSVIQYLGESHRVRFNRNTADLRGLTYSSHSGADLTLFKADWAPVSGPRAVSTSFHDTIFYIPRIELRKGEGNDRTLKTLSFLDQLIALQTSESAVRGTQPVIAIAQ